MTLDAVSMLRPEATPTSLGMSLLGPSASDEPVLSGREREGWADVGTFEVTIRGDDATTTDVIVDIDSDATGGELAGALMQISPRSGDLYLGGQLVASADKVKDLVELDGSILTVGSPGRSESPPVGPRVVSTGGPDAGRVIAIPAGGLIGGRGDRCGLSVLDVGLSRSGNFAVKVEHGSVLLADINPGGGVTYRGRPLAAPANLTPGERWHVGFSEFRFDTYDARPAGVRPDAAQLSLIRQFRQISTVEPVEIDWPDRPTDAEAQPFPWAQVLLPLGFGAAMVVAAMITKATSMVLFALAGPILAIGSLLGDRRRRAGQAGREGIHYARAAALAQDELATTIQAEYQRRDLRNPSPADVALTALARSERLWERRSEDEDFLELRIGLANQPATGIRLRGRDAPSAVTIPMAPVVLNLQQMGAIGICGDGSQVRGASRNLLMQVAALHGPDAVEVHLLLRDGGHADWSWVRWIPHCRREDRTVRVGFDRETINARLADLGAVLAIRSEAMGAIGANRTRPTPAVVVLIEDIAELRDHPVVSRILEHGPRLGVYTIACERSRSMLPAECGAVIPVPPLDKMDKALVEVGGAAGSVSSVRLDLVAADVASSVARRIAPLRIAGHTRTSGASIPTAVRLLDLTGARSLTADELVSRWRFAPRSSRATIGAGAAGVFDVDLTAHGPHGLVAGTSGAGKSQLLMSLVLGLAFTNSPEHLQFVLVDFKGGGAFLECEDLPHTAAMVTNLDGGGAARAITALYTESRRRQAIFKAYGGDSERYQQAHVRGEADAALVVPRLVIIVDEFAQLAEEHPDLLDQFVNVARVGRSLGMHMILATQRPSGIINGQIKSNTDLRIALRVTDPGDSSDVIDKPFAADIPKSLPGRAFVRAADELVEVQTAAVGLPRPGAAVDGTRVAARDWVRCGSPPAFGAGRGGSSDGSTDLEYGVQLVREAAALGGFDVPPSPVLPPLSRRVWWEVASAPPFELQSDDGPALRIAGPGRGVPAPVPIGIEDCPDKQRQAPLLVHPDDGHLLVVGSAQSGRTTVLRSLTAAFAASWSPDDLHVHAFDFGGALRALTPLPHVGTIASAQQPDRCRRLITRLIEELDERVRLFAELGIGSLAEQRGGPAAELPTMLGGPNTSSTLPGGEKPLPYLVVLVDRWDVIAENEPGGDLHSGIRRLIKDGATYGMIVVVTSDGRKATQLTGDISNVLVLPLNDTTDYNAFGIKSRDLGEVPPPGRAIRAGTTDQVQIALVSADPHTGAQNVAVEGLAATLRGVAPSRAVPIRIRDLPSTLSSADLPGAEFDRIPVGLAGDEAVPLWWDARSVPMLVVTGAPGSGRSTLARRLARELASTHAVAFVDPLSAAGSGLPGHATVGREAVDGTVNFDGGPDGAPRALVVDNLEAVMNDTAITAFLDGLGSNADVAVLVADALKLKMAQRGALGVVGRLRTGVLLHPRGFDHRGVLGLDELSRDVVSTPVGRGLWVEHGRAVALQTAGPG
jgi:S-DNA-T family DNA segregation ATPase FtsK/SpoIIIE